MNSATTLPRTAQIGHVHLKVSDLDRSIAFYRDALGFALKADGRIYGIPAVFLAAGDYHHHVALNTFESAGATPPPPGHTGLFHVAILLPDRTALARSVDRLVSAGVKVDGGRDHGGTVSIYLKDPDGNGLELYYDVPGFSWLDPQGRLVMKNDPFDYRILLEESRRARLEPAAVS